MNRRLLIGGLVLAGSMTAPGCLSVIASAAGACGGNSTSHLAPIDCTNSGTVGGISGSVHLTVTTSGAVHVDALLGSPAPAALFLQVKAHVGISSNAGFNGAAAVIAKGAKTASVDVQMPECLSQVDTKIVPGTPTLDHVSDVYRVAAPLVELPSCIDTTTVPQSSTTLAPTTSSTVPPSPTTTPASTVPTEASTAPTPPSGGGGGTSSKALPPTGSDLLPALVIAFFGGLVGGALIAVARRRAT